jgi:hypothetical protein
LKKENIESEYGLKLGEEEVCFSAPDEIVTVIDGNLVRMDL